MNRKEDFPIPDDAPEDVKESLRGLRDVMLSMLGDDETKDNQVEVLVEQLEATVSRLQDLSVSFALSATIETGGGIRSVRATCGQNPFKLIGFVEAAGMQQKQMILDEIAKGAN